MRKKIRISDDHFGPSWDNEKKLWLAYKSVAGVDEAGRGPLAGPVVAAAVMFTEPVTIDGLRDSKKMSENARERCFTEITALATDFGVATVGPTIIDRIGILNATFLAMRRALALLKTIPDEVLVDGRPAKIKRTHQAIVGGDDLSYSIAAASVLAKVLRDRMMQTYDSMYPEFGFSHNKGYPTPEHLEILKTVPPCHIHRVTFAGVQYELPLVE